MTLERFSGTGLTGECFMNIQEAIGIVNRFCRRADIKAYGSGILGSQVNGVMKVQKEKDGTFKVGILEKDHQNPSFWLDQRCQTENELHQFLLEVHQKTGLLTHPLQERVASIEYPPEFLEAKRGKFIVQGIV